jgi:hypothetical protein
MWKRIAQIVLWFFVLFAGLITGGNLYDSTVVTPLWAWSPPQSVMAWSYGAVQGRFFVPVGAAYALSSLLLLIFSWRIPQPSRRWALAAAVCGLVVILSSALFFIPLLLKTEATRGAGLSGQEIVTLANRFVRWNWVRLAVLFGSLNAGLLALIKLAAPDLEHRTAI